MTKVYLVLLLAAFAFQINADEFLQKASVESHQGVIDDIKILIEKLEEVVEATAKTAEDGIRDVASTFEYFVDNILDSTTPVIKDIIATLVNKLDDLEKKAAQAGVDVTECTKGREEEIRRLPEGLYSCATNALTDVGDIVKDAVKDIKDILEIPVKRLDELIKCKNNIITLPVCAAKVGVEVTADTVQLPLQILAIPAKVKLEVEALKVSTEACLAKQFLKIPLKGGIIIAKVTACVLGKINRH